MITHYCQRYLPQRLATLCQPVTTKLDRLLVGSSDHQSSNRMALITFLIRVMSAALVYILQVLLARWMGSYDYGIYVIVWVWALVISNLVCLGFPTAVVRFIGELQEKQDKAGLHGVFALSRWLSLAASSIFMLIGFG